MVFRMALKNIFPKNDVYLQKLIVACPNMFLNKGHVIKAKALKVKKNKSFLLVLRTRNYITSNQG